MAAELKLPLVLHGRGESVFVSMLDGMRRHLDREHRIHWHCINPKTDLITIASFLGDFPNSFLGFNCSSFSEADTSLQNTFNAWLLDRQNVPERMALETDFPFLKPLCLLVEQYSPVSAITFTAHYLVNVLRRKKFNTARMIDQSNANIRTLYGID